MMHRSPEGQGTVALQSCRSLLPHAPSWHCVDAMPRPVVLGEPQHTAPLGHVSAVHAMTTPTPPSHAPALSTHIISLQHTCGGLFAALREPARPQNQTSVPTVTPKNATEEGKE
jgi:hypothetical protein